VSCAEYGSARRVWFWFYSENSSFPLQHRLIGQIRWLTPIFPAILGDLQTIILEAGTAEEPEIEFQWRDKKNGASPSATFLWWIWSDAIIPAQERQMKAAPGRTSILRPPIARSWNRPNEAELF
jgi:hypothetical protein